MSYTLQGDAGNLDDIRRDIAMLKELEAKLVASGVELSPEQVLVYNLRVSREMLRHFGAQIGQLAVATRLWNVLCKFDESVGYYQKWYPDFVPLGLTEASQYIYIGQMCSPSLLIQISKKYTLLECVPDAGRKCLDLLGLFVKDQGQGMVELGSAPKGWQPACQ